MGSRVVPTTATPDPWCFNKRGHRSIDRPISSDRNEGRQTDKTGKQTNNKKRKMRK